MKIATHNSATGEKGHGILSWLGTPFACCQSKTLAEQYKAGCRYFDIRVKYTKRGWICAHGLWESKRDLHDILNQIDAFSNCYVMLTYEGEAPKDFLEIVDIWVRTYDKIIFTDINAKKPIWHLLKMYNSIPMRGEYKRLDGTTWHTYIPIPWLWKKVFFDKPIFINEYFKMVDFL